MSGWPAVLEVSVVILPRGSVMVLRLPWASYANWVGAVTGLVIEVTWLKVGS